MQQPGNAIVQSLMMVSLAVTLACCWKRDTSALHANGSAQATSHPMSDTSKNEDKTSISVQLTDGSRIFGIPLTDTIAIRTQYARLALSYRLLSEIEMGRASGLTIVSLASGERVQGSLLIDSLNVSSLVGQISVPIDHISSIIVFHQRSLIDSGLVAYFPFTGDAQDKSGHDHHGAVVGVKLARDRFGIDDHAYSFDGNESYIIIPDGIIRHDASSFSISLWLFSPAVDQARSILYLGASAGEAMLKLIEGNIVFQVDVNRHWYATRMPVTANTWTHVVAVYRRGISCQLWIDAERSSETSVPAGDLLYGMGTHTSSIGSYAPAHLNHSRSMGEGTWLGAIDEVRFYDRALQPEEIKSLLVSNH